MYEVSIIIPAYNAHKTIEATLCSIAYQMLDRELFNVVIVNDSLDNDYSKEVEFFSNFINIKEIQNDRNGGPGFSRQHGIDESNSKYIVFMDSDDCFNDCHSLETLYNCIKKGGYDIVISDFYSQNEKEFKLIANSNIWLHGKIFLREFLTKNNIRFNNSRHNEDNGFNQVCFLCGANYFYLNVATYIWKFNPDSITRRNNMAFSYDGLFGYADNLFWALDLAVKNKYNSHSISSLSFSSLVFLYYCYLEYYKKDNINELLKKAKGIKKIYYLNPLSFDEENIIIKNQVDYRFSDKNRNFILRPVVTLEEFLKLIDEA